VSGHIPEMLHPSYLTLAFRSLPQRTMTFDTIAHPPHGLV
jgi:hypothetical protein